MFFVTFSMLYQSYMVVCAYFALNIHVLLIVSCSF